MVVKNSFDICSITSSDPSKVYTGCFYQQCIEIARCNLELDHKKIEHGPILTKDD